MNLKLVLNEAVILFEKDIFQEQVIVSGNVQGKWPNG